MGTARLTPNVSPVKLCVCAHACTHKTPEIWYHMASTPTSSPYFLRQGLSLNLELSDLTERPTSSKCLPASIFPAMGLVSGMYYWACLFFNRSVRN